MTKYGLIILSCMLVLSCTKKNSNTEPVTEKSTLKFDRGQGAVFGRSDSCSESRLISIVDFNTDCETLSNADSSWSILKDGKCIDIEDTSARIACVQVKDSGAVFGRSDSCSTSRLIKTLDDFTDCDTFSNSDSAWSIMKDGKCVDINDTTARIACTQAQNTGAVFGRSDSCSSSRLIGTVNLDTDCNKFSNSDSAWSIMKDGKCVDIDDTTARLACSQIKGNVGGGAVFGRSDSCSSSRLISIIDFNTDCNTLDNSKSSWSIIQEGICIDIEDTTAPIACVQVKKSGAVFGRSDSCSSNRLLGTVDFDTDCNKFSNSDSAWSIMKDGKCVDIADTSARLACTQALGISGGAVFGRSDSCSSSKLISTINSSTDCDTLSNSDSSWSIIQDGTCVDIEDTTARVACVQAKNEGAVFGRSDSCSPRSMIGTVNFNTDCNKFSNSGSAWSVIKDGKCVDIDDTSPQLACLQAK